MSKVKTTKITKAERDALTNESLKISAEQKAKLNQSMQAGDIWDYGDETKVKTGDIFYGRFEGYQHYEKGKIKNDLALFTTEEGKRNIWMTTVLRSKFEELKIVKGDIISIRYDGQSDKKGKKKGYHKFSVGKL